MAAKLTGITTKIDDIRLGAINEITNIKIPVIIETIPPAYLHLKVNRKTIKKIILGLKE